MLAEVIAISHEHRDGDQRIRTCCENDEWMNHIFRASVAWRSGQAFCRSFRNCSGIHSSQNEQFGVRQFIG